MKYCFLLIFIIIIRSPGFFNTSSDSDFATYILVANSYVNNLGLYNNIIEAKPFLTFFPYIFAISLFGKNFLIIQLFGAIIIFITCLMIIKIYQLLFAQKNYLIGYIYSFYTTYLVNHGMDFQNQITATLFYVLGLFVFLKLNVQKKSILLGFFLGCSALTRQNFIVSSLLLTMLLPTISNKKEKFLFRNYITNFILITLGGLISILLFFIPFAKEDLKNIFNLIFYSPSDLFIRENLIVSQFYLFGHGLNLYKLEFKILPSFIYYILAFLGFIILLKNKEKKVRILNLFFFSSLIGVMLTNIVNNQHLIQISPFISLYFCYYINLIIKILSNKKYYFYVKYALIFILCLFLFILFSNEINNKQKLESQKIFNSLYDYLSKNLKEMDTIYINGISNNLYWFLDIYPPISIAHQSNIDKNSYLEKIYGKEFNSNYFYQKIINEEPNYLILNKYLDNFFMNHVNLIDINNFKMKYILISKFQNNKTEFERLFRNKYKKTIVENKIIYFYKKKNESY